MAQQTPRLEIPDFSDMKPVQKYDPNPSNAHFVQILDFDPECLGYTDATISKGDHPTVRSHFVYKVKDEWKRFVISLPEQFAYSGIQPTWKFMAKPEEQTDDTIEGFQIQYNHCSSQTLDDPTEAEQKALQFFDCIQALIPVAFLYECNKEERPKNSKDAKGKYSVVPDCVTNAFAKQEMEKMKGKTVDPNVYFKPIGEHPNKVNKDGVKTGGKDESKSQRTFLSLEFYKGKGDKPDEMKCGIYGYEKKGNKMVEVRDTTGLKYRDVKSHVTPAVRVDGIWWGSHMQRSWIASAQLKVVEIFVTPFVQNTQQRRYFAPRPDLEAPEDEDYDENDAQFDDPNGKPPTDEELGFSVGKKTLPNGDSANSLEAVEALMREVQNKPPEASVEDEEPQPTPPPSPKKEKKKEKKDRKEKKKERKEKL